MGVFFLSFPKCIKNRHHIRPTNTQDNFDIRHMLINFLYLKYVHVDFIVHQTSTNNSWRRINISKFVGGLPPQICKQPELITWKFVEGKTDQNSKVSHFQVWSQSAYSLSVPINLVRFLGRRVHYVFSNLYQPPSWVFLYSHILDFLTPTI